ncbi:MAG TPA: SDR family oxidoreductase [Gemmatimonadales bacterium]
MSNPTLAGHHVVVTGASRGIGAAIVRMLSAAGAIPIRIARSQLPALAGAIDFRCDLADPADRAAMLRDLSAHHPLPDAVVSNAGAFLLAPLAESTDALLREQLAINLEAPFALARHFVPAMQARGRGHHILIGSVADHTAFPGNAAYAASKFAARGLHEVLVAECRGTGVRCTLVSPGATDTTVWDPIDPDHHAGFTPRAEMLAPDDVAAAVRFALTAPGHAQVDNIRLGPA